MQTPFSTVQRKVLAPNPKAETPVEAEVGEIIVPVPPTKVQVPDPVSGLFPVKVAVVAQTDWSVPAAAAVKSSLVMETSSCESVQDPFGNVHRKVLTPAPNPVSPELGEFGEVIEPAPEIKVHVPTPVAGALPAKVAVAAQTA